MGSTTVLPTGLNGVVDGGTGKLGIDDRGDCGVESGPSEAVVEVLLLGMSSNFHSGELFVFEGLRRARRDILRPIASVASFAIALIDGFRRRVAGGAES